MRAPQRYVHGHAEAVLRSHRWRTVENSAAYLRPHLEPGQRLLDVGSGPGTITAELAGIVAPGEVVALETGEDQRALTQAELDARGVRNARTVVGDVHDLPFADGEFDVTHAHQVLQHVADPVAALREMARVTCPGGWVAARDGDYGGFLWWPALDELDTWRRWYSTAARADGGEPDAGRRLLAWAHEAGFEEVTATSSTWCFATPEDRAWWGGMWADRITGSAIAEQLLADGIATRAQLDEVARAWRTWAASTDGWFTVLHGEILIRVG